MTSMDAPALREKFSKYEGVQAMIDALMLPGNEELREIGSSSITKPGLPHSFYFGDGGRTVLEWMHEFGESVLEDSREETRTLFNDLCAIFAPEVETLPEKELSKLDLVL